MSSVSLIKITEQAVSLNPQGLEDEVLEQKQDHKYCHWKWQEFGVFPATSRVGPFQLCVTAKEKLRQKYLEVPSPKTIDGGPSFDERTKS